MRRIALVLGVVLSLLLSQAALAAGSGTISGTLVEKTPGGSLQPGGKATLYQVADNQEPKELSSADIGAGGHFSLSSLATDPGTSYQLLIMYAGAPYVSDKIAFAAGETQKQISVNVYEPTEDDKTLSVDATNIVLTEPDAKTHEMPFLELDTFINNSQRTFIPNTTPRNGGPPNLLRFSLPPDSSDLQAGSGIAQEDIIQIGTGFGAVTPLSPGQHEIGFSFRSPYQSSSLTFTKSILYPTKTLRVMAPASVQLHSPQLTSQGATTIGSTKYNLLVGANLAPGTQVQITYGSLPGISPLAFLSEPHTLVWIAVILGLAVLGLLCWYLYDRTRGRRARRAADAPEEAGSARRQLELEQRELLIALARLDDRYDAGQISAEDYHSQRETHKAELKQLMKELEAIQA